MELQDEVGTKNEAIEIIENLLVNGNLIPEYNDELLTFDRLYKNNYLIEKVAKDEIRLSIDDISFEFKHNRLKKINF